MICAKIIIITEYHWKVYFVMNIIGQILILIKLSSSDNDIETTFKLSLMVMTLKTTFL